MGRIEGSSEDTDPPARFAPNTHRATVLVSPAWMVTRVTARAGRRAQVVTVANYLEETWQKCFLEGPLAGMVFLPVLLEKTS